MEVVPLLSFLFLATQVSQACNRTPQQEHVLSTEILQPLRITNADSHRPEDMEEPVEHSTIPFQDTSLEKKLRFAKSQMMVKVRKHTRRRDWDFENLPDFRPEYSYEYVPVDATEETQLRPSVEDELSQENYTDNPTQESTTSDPLLADLVTQSKRMEVQSTMNDTSVLSATETTPKDNAEIVTEPYLGERKTIVHGVGRGSHPEKPTPDSNPFEPRRELVTTKVVTTEAVTIEVTTDTSTQRKEFGQTSPDGKSDELDGPDVNPSDPRVIAKIRSKYLIPPSTLPYNLKRPLVTDPSMGQGEKIREILGPVRNGFFVECGALDGEIRSNSLFFEKELGWEGLLLEADPVNFAQVIMKQRKAWISGSCLGIRNYPTVVSFRQLANQGRISDFDAGHVGNGYVDVHCFPLYSFMLALNRTRIDYFSLDVEGDELDVLRTIPFDKLDIKTLSVEFIHGKEGKLVMRKFMEDKGYYVHSEVTHSGWLANDYIFAKKGL